MIIATPWKGLQPARPGSAGNGYVIALSVFLALLIAALLPAPPAAALETVTTLDGTCATPKTVFQLGDTVCAKVENVAGGDLNNI